MAGSDRKVMPISSSSAALGFDESCLFDDKVIVPFTIDDDERDDLEAKHVTNPRMRCPDLKVKGGNDANECKCKALEKKRLHARRFLMQPAKVLQSNVIERVISDSPSIPKTDRMQKYFPKTCCPPPPCPETCISACCKADDEKKDSSQNSNSKDVEEKCADAENVADKTAEVGVLSPEVAGGAALPFSLAILVDKKAKEDIQVEENRKVEIVADETDKDGNTEDNSGKVDILADKIGKAGIDAPLQIQEAPDVVTQTSLEVSEDMRQEDHTVEEEKTHVEGAEEDHRNDVENREFCNDHSAFLDQTLFPF